MYRKGVSAIILNSKNQILLVNLMSFDKKYFAIPGGGVEEGESLEQAVYRELNEELGICKSKLEFISMAQKPLRFKFKEIKLTRNGKSYTGSERYFFGFKFTRSEKDLKIDSNEVRTYKWVSYKDLDNFLLFDNQSNETKEKINELFPDLHFN